MTRCADHSPGWCRPSPWTIQGPSSLPWDWPLPSITPWEVWYPPVSTISQRRDRISPLPRSYGTGLKRYSRWQTLPIQFSDTGWSIIRVSSLTIFRCVTGMGQSPSPPRWPPTSSFPVPPCHQASNRFPITGTKVKEQHSSNTAVSLLPGLMRHPNPDSGSYPYLVQRDQDTRRSFVGSPGS